MAWMETDCAFSMEDKMAAGAFGRARNYGLILHLLYFSSLSAFFLRLFLSAFAVVAMFMLRCFMI